MLAGPGVPVVALAVEWLNLAAARDDGVAFHHVLHDSSESLTGVKTAVCDCLVYYCGLWFDSIMNEIKLSGAILLDSVQNVCAY